MSNSPIWWPGYTYSFNVTGWGWLVLLLGVLIAGTAVVVRMS